MCISAGEKNLTVKGTSQTNHKNSMWIINLIFKVCAQSLKGIIIYV